MPAYWADQRGGDLPGYAQAAAVLAQPIRSLAWSPDARYLASGSDDGSFSLWNPAQGQKPLLTIPVQPGSAVHSLAWSPAGHQLATAAGKMIVVWNLYVP